MKLYYVSNNRIPTSRAHGIQIVQMCAAFANAKADVTLIIPKAGEEEDVFAAYGLSRSFHIVRLKTLRLPLWIPGAFIFNTFLFARAARQWLQERQEPALVYTRGEMAALMVDLPARFLLVWETHIKPDHPSRYRHAAARSALVVAVTKRYAEEILSLWGISTGRVLWAPDGVSLGAYSSLPTKSAIRHELGLPEEKKIILYAGGDLPWKGLSLLRQASELLPPDVTVLFVGAISEIGAPSPRRFFAGPRPYPEIPKWLAAADVLVLTGEPKSEVARYYTSPLKLFEYMASGRPIVATDLPAIRDVLSEDTAYLAEPTPAGLAHSLGEALGHMDEAATRAKRARALVERYSWDARARAILSAVSHYGQ